MKKLLSRRRIQWLGASALILASLYALISLTPWSIGMCGEESVSEAYSPDGKYLAKVFVGSCGATDGVVTHVNLRSRWSYFNPTFLGRIQEGQVFGNGCLSRIDLVWSDSSNLEIQYLRCAINDGRDHAFMKMKTWKGINITYRELPNENDSKPH